MPVSAVGQDIMQTHSVLPAWVGSLVQKRGYVSMFFHVQDTCDQLQNYPRFLHVWHCKECFIENYPKNLFALVIVTSCKNSAQNLL